MDTVVKNKKRSYRRLFSNILLITAILCLNYPIVSDVINTYHTEKMYSEYMDTVSSSVNTSELEEKIDAYNSSLVSNEGRFLTEKTSREYNELLNIQSSILAYVDVPTAGVVHSPVYHYASTESLQAGCGHMAGSSFPSDVKACHMAISAHSGMSGQKGFSALPSVKIGDEFTVSYLDKILYFRVFRIRTVEPDDMSLLEIQEDSNLCSLITCTPIGLNTHRLVVTGFFLREETVESNKIHINASSNIKHRFSVYELAMSGVSLVLLFVLLKDLVQYLKSNNKKIYEDEIKFVYLEEYDLLDAKEVFKWALKEYYEEGG